jgi:uncharacterized membrane protein
MSTNRRGPSDHVVEQLVGRLLQIGVGLSAAVVMIGGVLVMTRHGGEPPAYSRFSGEPASLTSLPGILQGALVGDARCITQLGLVILIATPIIRVAFTLVAFAFQRDRLYVLITSIVLAVLLYGFFSGHA